MSILPPSLIHPELLLIKAFIACTSGDIINSKFLCLRCLESLQYNKEFHHLAFCMYMLSRCLYAETESPQIFEVVESLHENWSSGMIRITLPWSLLQNFTGTTFEFFQLTEKSQQTTVNNKSVRLPWSENHTYMNFQDWENLAIFCLELNMRELAVNFAIQAHIECQIRASPDNDEDVVLPSVSHNLLVKLGMQTSDEEDLSNLSEEVSDELVNSSPASSNEDFVVKENIESLQYSQQTSTVMRKRKNCSILKSPISDREFYVNTPEGGGDQPKSKRHVRFSLSSRHPPPYIEAENGGRSNRKRLLDFSRRCQNSNFDEPYESSSTLDRFATYCWPPPHRRSFSRRLAHLLTCFLIFLLSIACSLLFISLVFCIPVTWLARSTNNPNQIPTNMCTWLLDRFYLQSLIS